jgi:hypothetical protein
VRQPIRDWGKIYGTVTPLDARSTSIGKRLANKIESFRILSLELDNRVYMHESVAYRHHLGMCIHQKPSLIAYFIPVPSTKQVARVETIR